jgi:hypothetical protein
MFRSNALRAFTALSILCAIAASGVAQAADAGRVVALRGGVSVVRDGQIVPIQKGDLLRGGDILTTDVDGRVQWQMTDESYFGLKPDSRFTISDYQFDGAADAGKSSYLLTRGGVSTLTGKIKSPGYALRTSAAGISVLGTRYKSAICKGDCKTKGGLLPDGMYVGVDEGIVLVANRMASLSLKAGQYAYVKDANTAPALLDGPPAIFLEADLEFEAEVEVNPGNAIERPGEIIEDPASPS